VVIAEYSYTTSRGTKAALARPIVSHSVDDALVHGRNMRTLARRTDHMNVVVLLTPMMLFASALQTGFSLNMCIVAMNLNVHGGM